VPIVPIAPFAPFAPFFASAVSLLLASPSGQARAAEVYELPSVLVIAKSSNKNQVHYAARVDDSCTPVGPSPVRAYWLMLEHGPHATEPLLDREKKMLGLERQEVSGNTVQFALRAMPGRTFVVHTSWVDNQCSSWVGTTIAGVAARVTSVYVQQKLFGVAYVLLSGASEDGAAVRERVSP
jgi:hypothetical protein